jgi:hypothetical protein
MHQTETSCCAQKIAYYKKHLIINDVIYGSYTLLAQDMRDYKLAKPKAIYILVYNT